MSKELTLTVDPRLTDSTKLRAILRTNPPPHTACKRHSRLLIHIAEGFHEGRILGIPVHPDAAVLRIIDRHYID